MLWPCARHIDPSLVLVQPKKTRPYKTERLLMGCKKSNQTNKSIKDAITICYGKNSTKFILLIKLLVLPEYCKFGNFRENYIFANSLKKVRKRAKIRNHYNQAPHLTQDANGKMTTSQLDITNKRQEVSPFTAGDHKASINRRARKHNKNKTEIT